MTPDTRKLHWEKIGTRRWFTTEQYDGTPDFVIEKIPGNDYRLKSRTSAKAYEFDTLAEAKRYAASI